MSAETSLVTFDEWTLRVRPPLAPASRVLLMLHGWQGDENSMWVFARNFPADCWIVAPRAPRAARQGGYTWRAAVESERPNVEGFRPAVAALLDMLERWAAANGADTAQLDVTGFSQGAAMTFMLGLLHPQRVRKMGILAGFAPEGAEQLLALGHFDGRTIFVAHGARDETVPVEQARRSVRLLEQAGARVEYCESELGHKLSAGCLKALELYLST